MNNIYNNGELSTPSYETNGIFNPTILTNISVSQTNIEIMELFNSKYNATIMNNDKIPGPVKKTWATIKEKEYYVLQQNKLNTIFINDYQQRDFNYEIINFINYTWQDIQVYNLPKDVLDIFKQKLTNLYNIVKK
jgi:hypothetical protein